MDRPPKSSVDPTMKLSRSHSIHLSQRQLSTPGTDHNHLNSDSQHLHLITSHIMQTLDINHSHLTVHCPVSSLDVCDFPALFIPVWFLNDLDIPQVFSSSRLSVSLCVFSGSICDRWLPWNPKIKTRPVVSASEVSRIPALCPKWLFLFHAFQRLYVQHYIPWVWPLMLPCYRELHTVYK